MHAIESHPVQPDQNGGQQTPPGTQPPVDPPSETPAEPAELTAIFSKIPDLRICKPSATPFIEKAETLSDTIYYQSCKESCADWKTCTSESTVRGRVQLELSFVVDEDHNGNGFGGTLRWTKSGDTKKLVFFHKGGSGTDWVEDYLPEQVEAAGGIAFQPKWFSQGTGWFMRPYSGSTLERSLAGVTQRPASVMKWAYRNLTQAVYSTAGCSGGSIATYYPRHWYGLDPILKYQLVGGGPVMADIESGCRGGASELGRCTSSPTLTCNADADCGVSGGSCSEYEWNGGPVMTAVRKTIDQLHFLETGAGNFCLRKDAQPLFAISNFDNSIRPIDDRNEHPIDFLMNVGSDPNADNGLNVLAQGALVYSGLKGAKTWNVQPNGIHCDATNGPAGWALLKTGAGL
jgi:hypothetical protein